MPTRRDVVKSGLLAGAAALAPAGLVNALAAEPVVSNMNENAPLADGPRQRLLLDRGWRFALGASVDPAHGYGVSANFGKGGNLFVASNPRYDASGWRELDLPHDWAIDLPFVADPRLTDWGFKPLHHDYPETSIGWYRRVFTLPASDAGRRLSIEFDGVFRDATVALNGHLLGRNLSGYAPFRFDITELANVGGDNVLMVRVDATEHEGWFYEGAGIYRHVWLVTSAPLHVPQWGTYVTSEVKGRSASIRMLTEIANESDAGAAFRVVQVVQDDAGRAVARAASKDVVRIEPWARSEQRLETTIADVTLWSPETPKLYTLVTTIEVDGAAVDRYETPFGVRTIRFDAKEGFFLNGARVEVKGTCNHHDHAGVGAALPDALQSYRINRLKEFGSNAYRTSHNPPTPELLDACDRIGMLVLDETRMFGASEEALSQLERMLRRDRNHPSIIAWSIANEEPTQGMERGERVGRVMARMVRRLDPTRPVAAAMDQGWGKGITNAIDIQGFNYRVPQMDGFHAQFPAMPVWGTETGSTVSTRGIYENDTARGYVSAYDANAPWWASTAEAWWSIAATRRWIAGGFIWTGFDYRGEPTPYAWPCISSHFGVLDSCGFPKDNFYYYKAWWTDAPLLHLFPHWNWAGKEGKEIEVWCHTNLDRVELLVNGQSQGTREVPRNSHAMWKVPYAPGRLEARAFRGGQQVLTQTVETTGPAARLVLTADRSRLAADGEDAAVIRAAVVDASGRVVPVANDEITFEITGAGRLLGVGNGDPSSHESDRGPKRRAFNGLCAAIVQSGREAGTLHVRATAGSLATGVMEIDCQAATARSF